MNNIDSYNNIKIKIYTMRPYFETAMERLRSSSDYLASGVILDGQPYDKGVLKEYADELGVILESLESVARYCSTTVNTLVSEQKSAALKNISSASSDSVTRANMVITED